MQISGTCASLESSFDVLIVIEMIPGSSAGLLHRSDFPASKVATLKGETLLLPGSILIFTFRVLMLPPEMRR